MQQRYLDSHVERLVPECFLSLITEGHKDIEDSMSRGDIPKTDSALIDQQDENVLNFRFVFYPFELGEGFDVGHESDDFSIHVLVG